MNKRKYNKKPDDDEDKPVSKNLSKISEKRAKTYDL